MFDTFLNIICLNNKYKGPDVLPQGGDFDDLYPDVCVEGLEKDPF